MDSKELETIRIIAIKSMVSDDTLMEKLILKGGNALDLIHKIAERASVDLDFSIEDTFDDSLLDQLEIKMEKLLVSGFRERGFFAFDISLSKRPSKMDSELESFWGGYKIEFKVVSNETYESVDQNLDSVRRRALPIGQSNSTKFHIEISRFEHCPLVDNMEIEGFRIRVYSPTLIVIEKLRAICQQMVEYRIIVPTSKGCPSARDFFDIHTVINTCSIDLCSQENLAIIVSVFEAKKVPLDFLKKLVAQNLDKPS